jgi:S-adenosyl-L-methionine hydrolase (adenosine-forming)
MIVTLLTDFGLVDHYAGVMRGVLMGTDPEIRVVDLTHEIAPGRIDEGAFALLAAYLYFPRGTVHVAVVDPGVGSARRAIVVEAAEQYFVGPDNGLFSYVLEREAEARAVEVTNSQYFRQPLSTTFHGRDLFAPVGAALARGVRPEELGPPLPSPTRLAPLRPLAGVDGGLQGRILHVDRFGNCITSVSVDDLVSGNDRVRVRAGGRDVATFRRHYTGAPAGDPFLIWGSTGFLEISLNGGSAAAALGLAAGDGVEVAVMAGGGANGTIVDAGEHQK